MPFAKKPHLRNAILRSAVGRRRIYQSHPGRPFSSLSVTEAPGALFGNPEKQTLVVVSGRACSRPKLRFAGNI